MIGIVMLLSQNFYHSCICYDPSTPKEIENIIKTFQAKDSCGYDLIPLRITILSAPYISSPFCYICNRILLSGVFPDRLKYAIVKPVHKNGDKTSLANYRPISLLTSFSKVVERVMYNRLIISPSTLLLIQISMDSKETYLPTMPYSLY
jgi:hypothetical protein